MKAKACCNLGSLNLYEFVDNKFMQNASFNWDKFEEAINIASNALDDVIDENADRLPEELHEYRENAHNWRNIGLGTFNYAYMLIALGLKYGSEEALNFTNDLFYFMMVKAINANIERGKYKGNYPKFKPNKVKQSRMFNENWKLPVDTLYFRNCSLLSIAPNGSIATLLGGSGGIEPEFALSYTRRTDNLKESYTVESNIVKEYRQITGNQGKLPDYFVSSADIHWRDRIKTQAVIQKHIDTAISSTVNLPKETTQEEIEELYLYAWSCGLKGITIFRDGCKRLGILLTDNENKSEKKKDKNSIHEVDNLPRGFVASVSDDLAGYKRKLTTGCGTIHFEVYADEIANEIQETFINIGSSGGYLL